MDVMYIAYRFTGTHDALCLLIILQGDPYQVPYPGVHIIINFVRK